MNSVHGSLVRGAALASALAVAAVIVVNTGAASAGSLPGALGSSASALAETIPGLRAPVALAVSSPDFAASGSLPAFTSALGGNTSPALQWTGTPAATREIDIIVQDPDVPIFPAPFVHGLVTGVSPTSGVLPRGAVSAGGAPAGAHVGKNSLGLPGWIGPAPIPGTGRHRYVFQVFAVDTVTGLDETATVDRAVSAMTGHVLAVGSVTGFYG
jgi:Raf kinase inhibitor-like YbhB/YbcL family protein